MKNVLSEKRNEFFHAKFKSLYQSRWKDKGLSQEQFAKAIRNQFPNPQKCPCTYRYVSNWLTGKAYPEQYLPQIAKALNVDESEFFPQTQDERFSFDSEFQNEFAKELVESASELGLDLYFLRAMERLIDFPNDFPKYTPFLKFESDNSAKSLSEYFGRISISRLDNAVPAPMSDQYGFLQIEKDGKLINLSYCDFSYLKEVQEKVKEYVEFLFAQRRKEMEREEVLVEESTFKRTPDNVIVHSKISPKRLNEIDRFGHYYEGKHGGIIFSPKALTEAEIERISSEEEKDHG